MAGHGYCHDYVVERLFRDARGLMFHLKTSEWLRREVAKQLWDYEAGSSKNLICEKGQSIKA
jgi:alkylation response protein AidB-like acyl-CoA dehydrogenase